MNMDSGDLKRYLNEKSGTDAHPDALLWNFCEWDETSGPGAKAAKGDEGG